MPNKLSVTIIAYNEEERIRDCLESVKWADEIVVVDSGSTDETVKICREFTDKIYQNEFLGYGKQKNFTLAQAHNSWILSLDADETVSPELKSKILAVLENPVYDVYQIARKNFFGEVWVRYGGWYPDFTSRLFNREKARFNELSVHESVNYSGLTGKILQDICHYTYRDISDYVERMNKYTSLGARELKKRGKKASWSDLTLRPFFTFLKKYFLDLGFLEGLLGLRLALLAGFSTYLKYAKLKDLNDTNYYSN